jgi:membrane protein DedA with SNARE-associated domain
MLAWFETELPTLLATYGYGAVAVLMGLESLGFPVPGATVLVAASLYAGVTDGLDIAGVILAAGAGVLVGDNLAYWAGRTAGYGLLVRFGPYLGLTEQRMKLGRHAFQRYGTWVVVLGRFALVLRVLVTLLAGINGMGWTRFLLFNTSGVITWTAVLRLGAFALGAQAHRLVGPVGAVALVAGATGVVAAMAFIVRRKRELLAEAEAAGPRSLHGASEEIDASGETNRPARPDDWR